ncbi:MAG: hypothetical protein RBU37_22730 [Myxococcota bacterium]|nr:hypothetical protein [Myxococcota bacterium]
MIQQAFLNHPRYRRFRIAGQWLKAIVLRSGLITLLTAAEVGALEDTFFTIEGILKNAAKDRDAETQFASVLGIAQPFGEMNMADSQRVAVVQELIRLVVSQRVKP